MSRNTLLAVQGPLQLINGISSLLWSFPNENTNNVTLLLYDFLCPQDVEQEVLEATLEIAGAYSWKKICIISSSEMANISRVNIKKAISFLKSKLSLEDCSTMFFAQAEFGFGGLLLHRCYGNSEKIAYGDAFGMWITKNHIQLSGIARIKYFIKSINRRAFLSPPHVRKAVLSIPVAFGEWPRDLSIDIPSKSHLVQVINHITCSLPDLQAYCAHLLKQDVGDSKYLFLSSNLSTCRYMSEQSEASLYLKIIKDNVPFGSTLYIKPHIRSPLSIVNILCSEIRHDYNIILIDDVRYGRFPIELWQQLIYACTMISPFSFSSAALNYFYDITTYGWLTTRQILLHAYPERVSSLTKLANITHEKCANLSSWDRKSPL